MLRELAHDNSIVLQTSLLENWDLEDFRQGESRMPFHALVLQDPCNNLTTIYDFDGLRESTLRVLRSAVMSVNLGIVNGVLNLNVSCVPALLDKPDQRLVNVDFACELFLAQMNRVMEDLLRGQPISEMQRPTIQKNNLRVLCCPFLMRSSRSQCETHF